MTVAAAGRVRVYVPSYNNSHEVAQTVATCRGLVTLVSDNGSNGEHVAALHRLQERESDCEIVFHQHNQGRVANWAFCVRHFIEHGSGGEKNAWMKWLFAGDRLREGAAEAALRAACSYPAARLIVAEHDMVASDGSRQRWRQLEKTQLIEPAAALRLTAERGNWFGPPLAHWVRRDAVADGFDFGEGDWSADLRFCLEIVLRGGAHAPVLYLAESVGEFRLAARRYFQAHGDSQIAALEEGAIRLEAARRYKEWTGDEAGYNVLIQRIERDLEAEAVRRVLQRSEERDSGNLAEQLARSLPLGALLRVAARETGRRISRRLGPRRPPPVA